ncbi:hypothetical protein ACFXMT_14245 [Streptomyces mirabilis]|uniref:hypothetical protein n=1 Tax=Streptomyces mirabilis TaxID=68239 RepID=UPI0036C75468
MAGIDALLSASVKAVQASGALEGTALMATVSAVNSDGTVNATRAGDSFPKVRMLRGAGAVAVADTVEILKTAGGWICLGSLASQTQDTGWVPLTLISGITPYTGTGVDVNPAPAVRRIGKVVYIRGRWTFGTSYVVASDRQITAALPAEFRPATALELAANAQAIPSGYAGKIWLNNSYEIHFWCGAATAWGGIVATSWLTD